MKFNKLPRAIENIMRVFPTSTVHLLITSKADKRIPRNSIGYVLSGAIDVEIDRPMHRRIVAGNWFVLGGRTGQTCDASVMGRVLIVAFNLPLAGTVGIDAAFAMGEVPDRGALRYIDGAWNSLLYGPQKLGAPCLNMLHIPCEINQTAHTHPSERIGIVLSGRVKVKQWEDPADEPIVSTLDAGDVWTLDADTLHSFHTTKADIEKFGEVRILAFHPDSDFGATDEVAPMINRTIVDGKSASELKDIQTK